MTATKACGRHATGTRRIREECRRPKAASNRRRAKRVLAATPDAPLAVAPPEGAGGGGALGGTAERVEPDGETALELDTGTGAESEGSDAKKTGAGPEVDDPVGEP